MTKEEAIKVLKEIIDEGWLISDFEKCIAIDACEMAIEALEILDEFERAQIVTGGRLNGRTYAYKCGLEDGKRKALELKKGKWIIDRVNPDENNKIWNCHCSECKKDPQDYIYGDEDWWLEKFQLPNYCPNCGIEMEGVE